MDAVVYVEHDIADLVPRFLENRRWELVRLRAALAAHNFHTLAFLGEQMHALGNPYGFREVTRLGRAIRDASLRRDEPALAEQIALYGQYLLRLQVVIVNAPAVA
jgi:hypothetical protein